MERKIRTALQQAGFEAWCTLTPRFGEQVEHVVDQLVDLLKHQWDVIELMRGGK